MIILLFYTIIFQVGNNYVINFVDPYTAFFIIYFLASLLFLLFNFKKNIFRLGQYKYTIPIILTGQVAAPFFYFKGVFLSDILTQSMLYALYPLTIIVFSKLYDKEKFFTKKNITIISVIALQILLLIKNIQANEGFYYLLLSCLLLITHKIIHKIAIRKEGSINEYSITLYGLLCSAFLGALILLFNGENLLKVFSFVNYINLETNKGILFSLFFISVVFLLGKIQFKRNIFLNKNKFEELYLYIIIIPPFVLLINNFLYFIDNKIEINFSMYGIEGALYLVLFCIVKLNWRIIITYLSAMVLFYAIITSHFLIKITPFETEIIKVIYKDYNRVGIVEKKENDWLFIKNKKDYDPYSFITEKINLYNVEEFTTSKNERVSLYFKDFIASDESMIVYDTKTYKKYIFKELNDSIYKNMLLFQKMAEEKDYLVDFKIITKNEKKYIITDFVNGLTFEDYFGQYNKNYIKRINQDELLNYIIKIAEINLDLMKSGWINRDIHQNNILITDNGIRMIDYDLIFKIDDNNGIVDSNGFRNNLYDIFRFFYPKRDIIKNKFYFENQPPLDFGKNSIVINENLNRINRYVQDNSYIYSEQCTNKEINGLINMIKDLKNINKPYVNSSKEPLGIQEDCVNKALFFNANGAPSFEVFNLPSKYFNFNYVKIYDFKNEDLSSFANKMINYNLQQNGTNLFLSDKNEPETIDKIKSFIINK